MQDTEPDKLLLDRQQRVTSLYQATCSRTVGHASRATRGSRTIPRTAGRCCLLRSAASRAPVCERNTLDAPACQAVVGSE